VIDQEKLGAIIRSRLAKTTENFKWGLISGKHIGYEIEVEDKNTKMLGEYKFFYTMNDTAQKNCYRVIIYNKDGVYMPAMSNAFKKIRKSWLSWEQLSKSFIFILFAIAYFWLSQTCRKLAAKPEIAKNEYGTLLPLVCEHKSAIFFTTALAFVVVFVVGNIFKKVAQAKRDYKASKSKKKH